MNIAVILAAGTGQRFGSYKQFARLNDKPVITYALEKFNCSKKISRIIVVTIKTKLSHVQYLVRQYRFEKVSDIIIGGKERQDSVLKALDVLPDHGYVAIHDACRPLFADKIIVKGFGLVRNYQALIPVIPLTDTVKIIKRNKVIRTIDRKDLYCVQTPQFFEINLLKKAYLQAEADKFYATDDAGIIEHYGHQIQTISGNRENIKITEKQDLEILRYLL